MALLHLLPLLKTAQWCSTYKQKTVDCVVKRGMRGGRCVCFVLNVVWESLHMLDRMRQWLNLQSTARTQITQAHTNNHTQVADMKQFLSEYGMIWVGDRQDNSSHPSSSHPTPGLPPRPTAPSVSSSAAASSSFHGVSKSSDGPSTSYASSSPLKPLPLPPSYHAAAAAQGVVRSRWVCFQTRTYI